MVPPEKGEPSVHHQSLYPGVPTPRDPALRNNTRITQYIPKKRLEDYGPKKTTKAKEEKEESKVTKVEDSPNENQSHHKDDERTSVLPNPPPPSPVAMTSSRREPEEVENGMDVRFIPPSENYEFQAPSQRRIRHWIRATGEITDAKSHVMALAYMSDSFLLGTALIANDLPFSDVSMMVSLDHTIYFHKKFPPYKADEWLMHCVESPWTGDDRGLVIGRFFTQEGEHIATVIQEGLIRLSDKTKERIKSKM